MPSTGGRWLRVFHPRPAASGRLVCFPHAGGSASSFALLSRALEPDIEVAAVQYPGRQDRADEPLIADIGLLADEAHTALARALRDWDDKPLALFGHSMGAIVAYEVARRFSRPPGLLFISARRPPAKGWDEHVHLRDDAGLVAELRRASGADQDWLEHEKLLAAFLPAIRSDYQAIELYAWPPGPPLGCSITALVGDRDPYTGEQEASAWADYCTGAFDLNTLPGGHFYLDANASATAEIIAARFRSRRPGPGRLLVTDALAARDRPDHLTIADRLLSTNVR